MFKGLRGRTSTTTRSSGSEETGKPSFYDRRRARPELSQGDPSLRLKNGSAQDDAFTRISQSKKEGALVGAPSSASDSSLLLLQLVTHLPIPGQ